MNRPPPNPGEHASDLRAVIVASACLVLILGVIVHAWLHPETFPPTRREKDRRQKILQQAIEAENRKTLEAPRAQWPPAQGGSAAPLGPSTQGRRFNLRGAFQHAAAKGTVIVTGRSLEFTGSGLPQPPERGELVLWASKTDGTVAGSFRLPPGSPDGSFALEKDLPPGVLFTLTSEPATGALTPGADFVLAPEGH